MRPFHLPFLLFPDSCVPVFRFLRISYPSPPSPCPPLQSQQQRRVAAAARSGWCGPRAQPAASSAIAARFQFFETLRQQEPRRTRSLRLPGGRPAGARASKVGVGRTGRGADTDSAAAAASAATPHRSQTLLSQHF